MTSTWPSSSGSRAASSSATALAISTVLPADDLLTEMPIDSSPLVRVTAVGGAGSTLTSAISPSRTVVGAAVAADAPPAVVGVATMARSSKAATVAARVVTVTG